MGSSPPHNSPLDFNITIKKAVNHCFPDHLLLKRLNFKKYYKRVRGFFENISFFFRQKSTPTVLVLEQTEAYD